MKALLYTEGVSEYCGFRIRPGSTRPINGSIPVSVDGATIGHANNLQVSDTGDVTVDVEFYLDIPESAQLVVTSLTTYPGWMSSSIGDLNIDEISVRSEDLS